MDSKGVPQHPSNLLSSAQQPQLSLSRLRLTPSRSYSLCTRSPRRTASLRCRDDLPGSPADCRSDTSRAISARPVAYARRQSPISWRQASVASHRFLISCSVRFFQCYKPVRTDFLADNSLRGSFQSSHLQRLGMSPHPSSSLRMISHSTSRLWKSLPSNPPRLFAAGC